MKILVVQSIFLGDVILTLPLVQVLKREIPEAEIDFLVEARNVAVLDNHPAIRRRIVYDKESQDAGLRGFLRMTRQLKSEEYDVAFILPGSVTMAVLVFLSRIRRRIGSDQSSGMLLFDDMIKFPREARRTARDRLLYKVERFWRLIGGRHSVVSLFFTDVVPLSRELHAAARYVSLASPLGLMGDMNETPKLYPGEADRRTVDSFIAEGSRLLVALAPGSMWETKRWPAEYYAQLLVKLHENIAGLSFYLVGGREDKPLSDVILAKVGGIPVRDGSGLLTPLQTAELLRRCALLITNDTAAMHLGSAMGTPCVAIFGPTVPALGFTPMGNPHAIIERPTLWCRPCTPHGGHRCPIGTHECMRSISVDDVFAIVKKFLTPS